MVAWGGASGGMGCKGTQKSLGGDGRVCILIVVGLLRVFISNKTYLALAGAA